MQALEGAELENEGGSGTQWSHWEESLFYDEIMTGLSSGAGRSVLSNLTLALMEDSGWCVLFLSSSLSLSLGNGLTSVFLPSPSLSLVQVLAGGRGGWIPRLWKGCRV